MINFAQIPIFGRSFSVEYQAILDAAEALGYTLPDSSIQVAQNAYLEKMKSNGYWYTLDLFYVFRTGDSGLSDFATINWITPASYQITKVNSPSFDGEGFTGNSTTSYLNTNYNPATNATYFAQNSASVFTYINTVGSPEDSTNALWGSIGSLGNLYAPGYNGVSMRINASLNLPSSGNLSGTGYKSLDRSGSTTCHTYNETTKTDFTRNSNVITSASLAICRFNTQYGNAEHSMFGLGGTLSATEHGLIRSDYLDYVAAL